METERVDSHLTAQTVRSYVRHHAVGAAPDALTALDGRRYGTSTSVWQRQCEVFYRACGTVTRRPDAQASHLSMQGGQQATCVCLPMQSVGAIVMALSAEDFYRSSNGDRWQLIRDTASGRSFVRHEPNLSSGGRVTDTEVEEFLNRTGSSPENLALRALLDRRGGTDGS
jgi:hypothetical protein